MGLTQRGTPYVNGGDTDRWLSLIGGSALLFYGLRRRSLAGLGLTALGGTLVYRGATGRRRLYALLGEYGGKDGDRAPYKRAIKVAKTVVVNASPEALYRFWRDLRNLPRFMSHLASVEVLDQRRSHWVAKGPAGMRIEWDAAIINEVENELIAWQSTENADVYNTGSVHFHRAPGGRGTAVKVVIRYTPPAGALGVAVAKLFGEEPSQQVEADLRRLKQIMEAGEILTTVGQPSGGEPVTHRV